jgi:hypothetical protein
MGSCRLLPDTPPTGVIVTSGGLTKRKGSALADAALFSGCIVDLLILFEHETLFVREPLSFYESYVITASRTECHAPDETVKVAELSFVTIAHKPI